MKNINKKEMLLYICNAYGYKVEYTGESVTCFDDDSKYDYENIEYALIDWLDTLIESEIEFRKNNANVTWSSEIACIQKIKNNLLFNKESKALTKSLTYGKIPKYLNKQLSVFIDEQIKRVNKFVKLSRNNQLDEKTYNVSLPIEFVLEKNKLKYISIANKDFLKRLIFEGDTSEIEFYEKDIYDKNGRLDYMPLISMDDISKFELNVPTAITIANNCLKIQTPINYIHLF